MDLKLIPREHRERKEKSAHRGAVSHTLPKSPTLRATSASPASPLEIIRAKMKLQEISRDEKIIGKTCLKMNRYVTDSADFKMEEVKDLIADMQRSIIVIERRRKKR